MARIGIDIRYCSDYFPGIGRSTYELVRALGELDRDHELILLFSPGLHNTRFDIAALAALPGSALVAIPYGPFAPAGQWYLPLLARKLRLDLLHTPYYLAPYAGLPCPSLVTIHDIIGHRFPHYLSWRGRLFFEAAMRLAIRRAAHLLTVSQSARADIIAAYGVAPARVTAIHWGVSERFTPQPAAAVAALRQRYGLPERYLLYLGANKPHKNSARLLAAWQRLRRAQPELCAGWQLILAGHQSPRHGGAARGLEGVRWLPDVAEADLAALYSGAGIFAFVSFYEGFGLPPLEAMACGTPLLCANASALPEVVGDAALLVDPFSTEAIAAGLTHLLGDPALRARLAAQGLERARQFSWRHAALATLAVYERFV